LARFDTLRNLLKASPDEDLEDKAMRIGGEVLQKAEPILRTLDYPAGLVRGTIAGGLEAATGRDDLVDIKDVIRGKAPSSGEILEKMGVPEGGSLSDVLPDMYSDTGKGIKLKKGGLFDPTARGAAGFAADVALDPIALLYGKAAKGIAKEAAQNPKAFVDDLLERLKSEKGELDLATKRKVEKIKEPTEQKIAEALELSDVDSPLSYADNREKLHDILDFSTRLRLGIPESMPNEQAIEAALKQFYPDILRQKIPILIDPAQAKKLNVRGALSVPAIPLKPGAVLPEKAAMLLSEPRVSTVMHEGQHFRDLGLNPFSAERVLDEIIPYSKLDTYTRSLGMNDPAFLSKKLAKYKDIPLHQAESIVNAKHENAAREAFDYIKSLGIKFDINDPKVVDIITEYAGRKFGKDMHALFASPIEAQKFGSAGHFYEYPHSYELKKSMELLDPNVSVTPSDLKSNFNIINTISGFAPNLTPSQIENAYIHAKFPNINKILKRFP